MSPQDMRQTLIARTIRVIAEEGLEKTTTKAIVAGTGINEAYIYRCFNGKEDLMAKAFAHLDNGLVEKILKHIPLMQMADIPLKERWRLLFFAIWQYMLGGRDECLAYVRYYYSPHFLQDAFEEHHLRYKPVCDQMRPAFKEEANLWMILNHILSIMLNFAVRVHHGQMPNDDDYSDHVFRVIYTSITQYFKDNTESEA